MTKLQKLKLYFHNTEYLNLISLVLKYLKLVLKIVSQKVILKNTL